MHKPSSNYLDKKLIISLFNQSVSGFNAYCRKSGDDSYNTRAHLDDAGSKLYECFEAALKRTLVMHYFDTLEKKQTGKPKKKEH